MYLGFSFSFLPLYFIFFLTNDNAAIIIRGKEFHSYHHEGNRGASYGTVIAVLSFVFAPRDGCTVNGKRPRRPIKGAARRSPVAPARIHGWHRGEAKGRGKGEADAMIEEARERGKAR